MKRSTVVIGLFGTVLDSAEGPRRWDRWRPSISICQHDDLIVSRFELLHDAHSKAKVQALEKDIRSVSPETKVVPHQIAFGDAWGFESVFETLHRFASSYPFDPEREDYLVHITTGTHVAQICLFLLTESRHFPARLLQTSPPARGGTDRTPRYDIIDLDLSRYDRIAARFDKERADAASILKSGIATRNAAFNRLIDNIEKVVGVNRAPVLLMGPTGAGKSQLAARIFSLLKSRHQVKGDFVELNCATLRGDSAMSTLFGHVKGSFTGAMKDRAGHLKTADGGVLFLDEIGELGLDEQAMLLRALETGRFFPLGADAEVESEFQLIAGTNRDLSELVAQGRFREDLLARIDLWSFELPPLRERREDIEPNLDYELSEFARRTGRRAAFSREAREAFLAFAQSPQAQWTRNFRDLSGAVTRMCIESSGGRVTVAGVEAEKRRLVAAWHPTGRARTGGEEALKGIVPDQAIAELDLFDRLQLAAVVEVAKKCRSLSEAGRTLFASSRAKRSSTNDADRLRKYLARFGLTWDALQPKSA
jgi:transcriptional regulatory protein RtcR